MTTAILDKVCKYNLKFAYNALVVNDNKDKLSWKC